MDDPGYTDYDDPRLQPPEGHDPTGGECFECCSHGDACRRVRARIVGWDHDEEHVFGWTDRIAAELGCETCPNYDET